MVIRVVAVAIATKSISSAVTKMATRRIHGVSARLIADIVVRHWMQQGISFTLANHVMTRIGSGGSLGALSIVLPRRKSFISEPVDLPLSSHSNMKQAVRKTVYHIWTLRVDLSSIFASAAHSSVNGETVRADIELSSIYPFALRIDPRSLGGYWVNWRRGIISRRWYTGNVGWYRTAAMRQDSCGRVEKCR